MTNWLSTILICLPLAGALAIWLLPLPSVWVGSLATLVSLVEVGFWITALGRFDFEDGVAPARAAALVVLRPRRLLPRRPVRLLALARRADRGLRRGGVRLRVVGRARAAARLLRAAALPHRRGRGRLRRAGPARLLRVLRGDADPALRPDRRLGRRRAARRDDQVRRLHGRRLAADARGDRRLRRPAGHVRPDRAGAEHEPLALPRLRDRVRGQGAALPVPRLAAGRLPRVARRGVGAAVGRRSRRSRPTASCGSRSPSSRSRRTTSACRSSCSRRSGSSTARCSPSARPTSAA